jgi:serpin B
MKSRFAWLACVLLLPLVLSCNPSSAGGQSDVDALVRDNSAFAFDLYHQLAETEGNLFFSPYSISTALAMTYAGARGHTATEMAATLRFTLDSADLPPTFGKMAARLQKVQRSGGIRLSVANSLWPQKDYPFLEDYRSLLRKFYGVSITAVDYQQAKEEARHLINGWVADQTQDRIQNLIPPGILDELTRLVLVDAIYFKGKWQNQFTLADTKDEAFHVTAGKTVSVPMMSRKVKCRYASQPTFDLLALPYVGDELSMVILLPKDLEGISGLETELTSENIARCLGALTEQEVFVSLPRFKLTSTFRLDKTLASLGMVDAFSETQADFSGMDGRPHWLYIGAVLHKAFVEVNEEGTEAAAATAVVMNETTARPMRLPVFRADHPFVFLIRDKQTGSLLFAGRLMDPTKTGE